MPYKSFPKDAVDIEIAYTQQLDLWLSMAGFEHRNELQSHTQIFNLRTDGRPISTEQVWRVFNHIPYKDTPRKYALYAVLAVFYALNVVNRDEIEAFLQHYDIPHPKRKPWQRIWQSIERNAAQYQTQFADPLPSTDQTQPAYSYHATAMMPTNTQNSVAIVDASIYAKILAIVANRRGLIWLGIGMLVMVLLPLLVLRWRNTDSVSASERRSAVIVTLTPPSTVQGIRYEGIQPPPFDYPPTTIPHQFRFTDGIGYFLTPENLHLIFQLSFPTLSGNSVGGDGRPYFWMFLPDPNRVNRPSVQKLYQDALSVLVPLVDDYGEPTGEFVVAEGIYLDLPPADLPNN